MKRILAILLVAAMAFSVVACAVPEGLEQNTRPSGNNSGTGDNVHADPGLPSVWYNNESFTIMGLSICERENPARDLVYFDDVQYDMINEAVHDRNIYVEETYGVSIEAAWAERDEIPVQIDKAIGVTAPPVGISTFPLNVT